MPDIFIPAGEKASPGIISESLKEAASDSMRGDCACHNEGFNAPSAKKLSCKAAGAGTAGGGLDGGGADSVGMAACVSGAGAGEVAAVELDAAELSSTGGGSGDDADEVGAAADAAWGAVEEAF